SFRTLKRRLLMLQNASNETRARGTRWWLLAALAALAILPLRLVAQAPAVAPPATTVARSADLTSATASTDATSRGSGRGTSAGAGVSAGTGTAVGVGRSAGSGSSVSGSSVSVSGSAVSGSADSTDGPSAPNPSTADAWSAFKTEVRNTT